MGLLDFLRKKFTTKTNMPTPTSKNIPSNQEKKTFNVAGESFYRDNIASILKKNPIYDLSKKDLIKAKLVDERVYEYKIQDCVAELIPEPENPYDPNAIKVMANGVQIGYIKRGSCSQVRNLIKGDRIEYISVSIMGGNYKCVTYYGDGEYELEKETQDFSVTVTIKLK